MKSLQDLETEFIINMGHQVAQGEKAIAELAHFRQAFGLAPDLDLVAEFDRRGELAEKRIQELQERLLDAQAQVETYERSVAPLPVAS